MKEEILFFGIYSYLFSWHVQSSLFFAISAQDKWFLFPCSKLTTPNPEKIYKAGSADLGKQRGWESWICGMCCRDRYMLTATLTSFSGELGLVSHFCLNKMFDTVSDFFFSSFRPGCALAFPLSMFFLGRSRIVY